MDTARLTITKRFETLTGEPLTKLNGSLERKGLEPVVKTTREAWNAEQEKSAGS